jgi:hypothetical protein
MNDLWTVLPMVIGIDQVAVNTTTSFAFTALVSLGLGIFDGVSGLCADSVLNLVIVPSYYPVASMSL